MRIKLIKGNLTTYMNDCTYRWPELKCMLQMGWSITSDQLSNLQAG